MSQLEKNARILAAIEGEWRELGAERPISFSVRFNDYSKFDSEAVAVDDQLSKFLEFAENSGCTCLVSRDEYGDASVCATKTMEPTASNITAFQELLKSFANRYPSAYVDGWHYPPKKTVVFWPDSSGIRTRLAQSRAEVLFDGKLVNDPLRTGNYHQESEFHRVARDPADMIRFGGLSRRKTENRTDHTFTLVPSEFLHLAASKPPLNPEPTVSGFSQWVYSLYSNEFGNEDDRAEGKEVEKEIWSRRREAVNCTDKNYLLNSRSPWKLIHSGLHLGHSARANYFELPHLRVRGMPLRASPDLVYANAATSEALIVEVKFTRMAVPKNLWPNIWAQLWCYAQIDRVARAKKLTVVGEVWGEMFSRGYGHGHKRVDGEKLICLRASVRRDPRALPYDRFFRELFRIYAEG